MSIVIGNISAVWNDNICMVDDGEGPEKMVVIDYSNISKGNVLIMKARMPYILAATDGVIVEPIYVDTSLRAGDSFDFDTKRIPKTNIISGLSTNDKCEVCCDGVPLSTAWGTIKVSIANAQICAL